MTLIELMVAMAIVGLLFAVAAVGLRKAFDVGLKESARRLGSVVRYLRIQAVTEHQYLRLMLDVDRSLYWVEKSAAPAVISPEEEEKRTSEKKVEEKETEETEAEDQPTFEKAEGALVRETRLESGASFKDIQISYLPGKRTEGIVALYFFPDGSVTPAMINLKDEEDEDHFSVEVFPLSGRVRLEGEYRELEKK